MSRRSNVVRILGLTFLAIVLSAVSAALAQASPDWVINELTIAELGLESETIEGSGGSMTLEVSKLGIKIQCTGQSLSGKLNQEGKGNATVKLSKCTVIGAEKTCAVVEPISMKISHTLGEAKETIYDVIAAESGETIATIELSGEECALPESAKVTGKAAATVGKEETTLTLTFSKEAASAMESQLLFGVSSATLTGTMKFKLSGANTGQPVGTALLTTALCSAAENPCAPPKTFAANNTLESQLEAFTEAELTLSGMPPTTFKCKTSTLIGENRAERGQPLSILFTTWVFGMCGSSCSVPSTSMGAFGTLRYWSLGTGRLTILSPMIETKCPGQKCKFKKPTAVLKFEGETEAAIVAPAILLSLEKTVEGTCPASLTWTAKYRIMGLGPMYVTR